jgi:hypothetical protein
MVKAVGSKPTGNTTSTSRNGDFMNKIVLALVAALAFVGTVHAQDATGVGSTGFETGLNYDYARFSGNPWLSSHVADVFVQSNLGDLGSVAVSGGDQQTVTTYRLNQTVFGVGYANGVKLGTLSLVGAVNYTVATGDVWAPFNGHNSETPTKILTGSAEANFKVGQTLVPFVDYSHSYAYNSSVNVDTDTVVGGTYINLTDNLNIKLGFGRGWSVRNANVGGLSINYKL